jgi:hypothetical protein
MKTRIIAMALGGALALAGATAVCAADAWTESTMKPLRATSLDAAGAHVVSYFLPVKGACRLTMTIIANDGPDSVATTAPSRVQITVEPGRAAFVDHIDGKSSRFTCLYGAEAMNVVLVERVALSPSSE